RLSLLHQVEPFVDALQGHRVRNEIVDIDLAFHVPIDNLGHVRASARAPESRTLPHPPGDELEWTCRNFFASPGHADDDGLSPAAMCALQRLAHHLNVADALEGVIGTAVGQLNNVVDNV